MCINAGEEIVPVTKVSVSVQTDETIPKETKVNIFPYLCFYCEEMINSKSEIEEHNKKCYQLCSMKAYLNFQCDQCDMNFKVERQ